SQPFPAERLALLHFGGEQIEGERTGRLVGVDVLAVHLAAAHEELALAAERRPAAKRDGHGLGNDVTAERVGWWTVHESPSKHETARSSAVPRIRVGLPRIVAARTRRVRRAGRRCA